MKTFLLSIAWRNMWRNKKRTVIMISSVFFSVFFCVMMLSLTNGSCDYIVDAIIEREIGSFQVMSPSYWDDKTVDNFIQIDESTLGQWEKTENVKRIAPRIETYAMGWNGSRTKGLAFIGIDPEREAAFSKLDTRIVEGNYLSDDDQGVIIGKKCARLLGLQLGDTLTMISMGYHGQSANGLFVIRGIVEAFDPLLDGSVVYTSLESMQYYLSIVDGLSTVSVLAEDPRQGDELISVLKATTDTLQQSLSFRPWKELIEGTMAGASENKKSMVVYFYFLYLIVGFGLLSMVIMLTNERKREFSVMAAIGTPRKTIIGSLLIEMLGVSLLGILLGTAFSIPIVAYYHYYPMTLSGELADAMLVYGLEPVMPFEWRVGLFVDQALIVFSTLLVVMLYPIAIIRRLSIINAIR